MASSRGPSAAELAEILRMECGCFKEGRNLIICIDGTSNKFGFKNTNVIELYHIILKFAGSNQHTFYNSGIGTYAQPSWKSWNYLKQVLDHKVDLAIAWNFERTVMGAYRWLSEKYMEGDKIFLFGFSRGAFQVRVLSAMIDKVGLIFPGNEMQIPFAYELYADPKSDDIPKASADASRSDPRLSMAEHFKRTFSRENVKVHFVGAWDTVSSIGITRGKKLLPRTVDGMKHVCYFRHALALDERRVKFLPEYAYGGTTLDPDAQVEESHQDMKNLEKLPETDNKKTNEKGASERRESTRKRQQVKEVWFAGTHSDIGGGNVDNPTMNRSRPALRWMVFEAEEAGLRTKGFQGELSSEELIEVRESLTGPFWRLLEVLPVNRLTFTREKDGKKTTHKPHLGSSRKIHPGQKIHTSLLFAGSDRYTPKARPPKDLPDFWKKLDSEFRDWREFDVYDSIERIIDDFIRAGNHGTASLESLEQFTTSGAGRQALYEKLIATLAEDDIESDVKHRVLASSVNILYKPVAGTLPLRLSNSAKVRPLLQHLTEIDGSKDTTFVKMFMRDFVDHNLFTLVGHTFPVSSVAFSPDGRYLASGSWDSTIRLWDTKTWRAVGQPLLGHNNFTFSIAFSPDGKHIVSGSGDSTVRVWDVKTGKAVGKPLEGHTDGVWSVAYSPNGRLIASGSLDKTVRLWDAEIGEAVGEPRDGHEYSVSSVAFSPDGKFVASGLNDWTIRLWSTETHKPVGLPFEGHAGSVNSIVFSPDGKHILSGSTDETLRLWDVQTGKEDGRPFEGHTGWVWSVAFSPDGKRVVSGSDDRTVHVWNVATRAMEGPPLAGHTGGVWSVAVSPDGRRVASGSIDRTIRIWDVED